MCLERSDIGFRDIYLIWPNIIKYCLCKRHLEQGSEFWGKLYFEILDIQPRSNSYHIMLLPRLQPPLRAALTSIGRSAASGSQQACLNEAFAQLAIKTSTKAPGLTFVRYASHKAQGAVNKAKDGPGKRLGAKRSGGELTVL